MWIGLGLLWLVIQLPYSILLKLGRLVGWLMYLFMAERREIARVNLQLCFPEWSEAERRRVLKENFASNGIALFEMAIAWWWPQQRLAGLARIEGLEHLRDAAAQGRGVVLMSAHFTTLEIGAALLGQKATIDGMYREHKNAAFDYVQRRGRERHNADAVAVEREDVRSMLKSLRKGRAIWYAPTVTATATFARLGKALVVPFTQTRLPNGQGYLLTVHPPLENFPQGDEQGDALRINQWVEQVILQQPEQYMWVHRRFKTRPEGEARPYPERERKRKRRRKG
jgi:KDO2-lipid IV(A) lauroyltransferase